MARAIAGAPVRKRRRKAAYQKNQQNKLSMILVTIVVILLMIAVAYKNNELKTKIDAVDEQTEILNSQIAAEEARKEEIEDFKKYTETKGYAEEVAKEKLGLVYEGEIVFKENN